MFLSLIHGFDRELRLNSRFFENNKIKIECIFKTLSNKNRVFGLKTCAIVGIKEKNHVSRH